MAHLPFTPNHVLEFSELSLHVSGRSSQAAFRNRKSQRVDRATISSSFMQRIQALACGRKEQAKTILQGVSGSALSDQVLAITGPSGAGKTSLLDVLAKKVPAKNVSGTVTIDGKDFGDCFRHYAGESIGC